MKTSTKLIIIFLMCIPTSLLAYNLILKAEFNKGNFVREFRPNDNNIYIDTTVLTGFRHVVINGSLALGNGGFQLWKPHIDVAIGAINNNREDANRLSIVKELKDNLNAIVKNDTLFISFHTNGKYDNITPVWNRADDILRIYSRAVKSISIKYANVTVERNHDVADSLKLFIGDLSGCDIRNLYLQKLAVIAKDSSYVNISQSNKIGVLSYSLQNKSLLSVDENPAQRYFAERIDSAAKIQISGKAIILQKQLH